MQQNILKLPDGGGESRRLIKSGRSNLPLPCFQRDATNAECEDCSLYLWYPGWDWLCRMQGIVRIFYGSLARISVLTSAVSRTLTPLHRILINLQGKVFALPKSIPQRVFVRPVARRSLPGCSKMRLEHTICAAMRNYPIG